MNQNREIGIVGVISVLFAFLYFALMIGLGGCAHAKPHLWEMCRDNCASKGAVAAAVVGSAKPEEGEKPNCACGMPAENGGT